MRKYVLIPDSFKGTLSSREVCRIVAEAIRSQEPEAEICALTLSLSLPLIRHVMPESGFSCLISFVP